MATLGLAAPAGSCMGRSRRIHRLDLPLTPLENWLRGQGSEATYVRLHRTVSAAGALS